MPREARPAQGHCGRCCDIRLVGQCNQCNQVTPHRKSIFSIDVIHQSHKETVAAGVGRWGGCRVVTIVMIPTHGSYQHLTVFIFSLDEQNNLKYFQFQPNSFKTLSGCRTLLLWTNNVFLKQGKLLYDFFTLVIFI